ncbi:MAG: HAMP domain-containing protein [Calditrichaeota bacterium]|nr:MAG: HAMP domain-containing protein [Calditrichota bacterium]
MRRFFFPLFWKFTVAIILIVTVFGSINLYLIWSRVYTSLEEESEKRGKYISHSLAREAINPILYSDYISLQELLWNVQRIDSTVQYIFVLDEKGSVLVHTFEEGVPLELLRVNKLAPNVSEQVLLITPKGEDGRIIRDIAVPILKGKLGTVRIGILEESIARNVNATIQVLLIMVGVFLLIGIIGAFAFAQFINNPVREISRIADQLDLNALQYRSQPRVRIREKLLGLWQMPWRAEDELDLLAERFNGMISRLEDAYIELEQAHKSLLQSEKLASIGTLSAGIAHEINNPIAGLQNCLRRIKDHPENIPQNRKYLEMMDEAVKKIERVVRALLDYTRKEDFFFEPIDCTVLVEKALLLIAYQLEKARISVTKEIPSDLPPLYGSLNHLEQVLVNLLINSVHAINERRKVEPNCPSRIQITASDTGEHLQIALSDTGSGISPEHLEKIFDPFFTTKRVGEGTGLGLSVCYKIVEAHRGEITVKSKEGEGTTFYIHLPYYREEEETKPSDEVSRIKERLNEASHQLLKNIKKA